jgi:acetolactate decarboxylase
MRRAARFALVCVGVGVAVAAFAAFAASCAKTPTARPDRTDVRTFGALRDIMHAGRTEARVALSDVTPGPHAYAIGALSELRGEVTVVDDVAWLAYPTDDRDVRIRTTRAPDEQAEAALLVTANVPAWRTVPVDADVPFDALDARVEALAADAGVDVSRPFPVRIDGPLVDVRWHVIDGRRIAGVGHSRADHAQAAASGTVPRTTGTLVGFFSKAHHGVFTHMGSNTHFHFVSDEGGKRTGHVDHVVVRRGATLSLPLTGAKRRSQRLVDGPWFRRQRIRAPSEP